MEKVMLILAIFLAVGIFIFIVSISYSLISNAKSKELELEIAQNTPVLIDKDTMDFYLTQLQKMIEIYVYHKIEFITGESLSLGIKKQMISNDDLTKAIDEIQQEVPTDISDAMWEYFDIFLSREYIRKYIRTYSVKTIEQYVAVVTDEMENIIE